VNIKQRNDMYLSRSLAKDDTASSSNKRGSVLGGGGSQVARRSSTQGEHVLGDGRRPMERSVSQLAKESLDQKKASDSKCTVM